MITDIKAWLDEHPTSDMLEQNDDGSDYLPIWVVENLLDELTNALSQTISDRQYNPPCTWSRYNHKYAFHEIDNFLWLSTSHELKIGEQIFLCGSFIKLIDYYGNSNLIATGIAEATKNGVKVMGNKFGKSLNARTILKNKIGVQKSVATKTKLKPDHNIIKEHLNAIVMKDFAKVEKLEQIYDLKIGE